MRRGRLIGPSGDAQGEAVSVPSEVMVEGGTGLPPATSGSSTTDSAQQLIPMNSPQMGAKSNCEGTSALGNGPGNPVVLMLLW
jgi:hypothetical protein